MGGTRGEIPEIRFAQARGHRLAWQEFGSGEETIVAVPPAAQNIEAAWEWPEIRAMFDRFGSFSRYVHYDKRGTGASDRGQGVPGLDERVDDLRAVMDAAEVERAHLFAQSEGGATTILFAATYPHRVESLIMNGSAGRVASGGEIDDPEFRAQQLAARRMFADAWGTPDSMSVDIFAPTHTDNDAFREWFVKYERRAASAEDIYELLVQMLDYDVTELVGELDVPMLITHRRGDRSMPLALSEELHELARESRFVLFEGDDHYPFVGDLDGLLDEIERWVTGSVSERPAIAAPGAPSVTTLGRFAVTIDGVEVDPATWGSRRARVLLKYLVTAEGRPVPREELFDVLWPDETDRHRLGARLSVQLSAVRKVLGGGVVADRQTVAIDLDAVEVDLVGYLGAADGGDDEAVVATFGEYLPEHRYDDWAQPMRERVASRFTVAAHRLVTAALDADDHDRAAELARRILDVDPVDELAHASLVDALTAAGDEAAAERARTARAAALAD